MLGRFRRQRCDADSTHSLGPRSPRQAELQTDGSGGRTYTEESLRPNVATRTSSMASYDVAVRDRPKETSLIKNRDRSRDHHIDPLGLSVFLRYGLGGTSRQSWSKNRDRDLFWPQKWLPYEPGISSARISTFGYNAQFASSSTPNSLLNISDFAKDLLFQLRFAAGREEKRLDIGSAPLIFVAHSMGGLVVKKAFILGQNDQYYKAIIKAISGIVFLSTPHRGANLADVLDKILSTCLPNLSPKQFVAELKLNSPTIQEINEQFRHLAPSIDIVSFFETQATAVGPANVIILQRDSSTLGYPEEISKALMADHHSVSKYASREDPSYTSVRDILSFLIDKARPTAWAREYENESDEIDAVAEFLGHPESPSDDQTFFADKRLEGSGEWLFDHVTLSAWLKSTSTTPQFLWCTGKPGSGKSVLTSFLLQHLQEEKVALAYHFFRFGDQVKNNLTTFVLSTALQLAAAVPEFRRRLLRMRDDGINVQKAAPRHLWQKLFHSTLLKVNFSRPIFIVMDALDEMNNAPLLLKMFADFHSSHLAFRVLFVSRSNEVLRSSMDRLADRVSMKQIDIDYNKDDLRLYVEDELYAMRGSRRFKQQIIERLLESADGNFLWVYLVVNEILKCYTEDAVEEALHQTPADLEELYQRMDSSLAAHSNEKEAALGRLVLTWAICSRYPLNLTELARALEPEYSRILDLRHAVQQVCGEFITFDQKLHLAMIHSSARDSLLTRTTFNYHVAAPKAHQLLFSKCLQTLMRWNPKENAGTKRGVSFVYYAMTSWPYHLELAENWLDQESLGLLYSFFSSTSILHWISLLSLAGKLRILIQAAKVLTTFIKTSDKLDQERSPLIHKLQEKEQVNRWAQDLIHIVGKFGMQLQQHPKSIYKFVPALCPEQSIIRTQFSTSKHGCVLELKGNLAPTWDDCIARFSIEGDTLPLEIITLDRHFAIVLADGAVRLYYSGTCDEARSFHHGERVLATCFTSAGDKMATYGFLRTKIWDTRTAKLVSTISNPQKARALTMAFDEEGQCLLTCSDDRLIRYCDLQVTQDGWISLRDPLGSGPRQHQHTNSPRKAKFNQDGTLLAVAYRGLHPSVWELTELGPKFIAYCERRAQRIRGRSTMQSNMTDAQDLCWNPLTGHLLGVYNDGCIFKWHPYEEGYDFSTVQATSIQCSDDGKFFVTCSSNGTLRVWDFQHFTTIYQLSYSSDVTSVAIDKNECRIYDLRDKFCNVWEPNALFRLLESDDKSSDNLSTRGSSTQISLFSEASVDNAEPITALCLNGRSGYHVVGDDGGMVCVYDETGDRIAELAERYMTVDLACWSGDGSCVASSDLTRTVMVEQLLFEESQKQPVPVRTLLVVDEKSAIRQICLDQSGNVLLLATTSSIKFWSIEEKLLNSIPEDECCFWCSSPQDPNTLLGFGTQILKVGQWTKPLDMRALKIKGNSMIPSNPRDEYQRRPSRAYPMSPDEIEDKVDKVVISEDGQLALTETSQATSQGRREKTFSLLDLSALQKHSDQDEIFCVPLPPGWKASIEVVLGFISHEQINSRNRRQSSAHMASMSGMFESSRTSYGHVVVYISKDFWVCTFDFGAGASARVQRYFFLPRDWCNLDLLELSTVTRQGDILCPKNGQIAIISNGLCEEWID